MCVSWACRGPLCQAERPDEGLHPDWRAAEHEGLAGPGQQDGAAHHLADRLGGLAGHGVADAFAPSLIAGTREHEVLASVAWPTWGEPFLWVDQALQGGQLERGE